MELSLKRGKNSSTLRFYSYKCTFEAEIDDSCIMYSIFPRRVNLDGAWFGTIYANFDSIAITEHACYSNIMTADFRVLFTSIFKTPYAWEGFDACKEKTACFLTDSRWLSGTQDAPVALKYPNQTMNGGQRPLSALIPLQDGRYHIGEPMPRAEFPVFRDSLRRNTQIAGALWLLDDITIR